MEDEDDVDIVGEFQEDVLLPESSVYDGMSLNLAELLPDLGPHSWLLSCNQSWNLESDIEVRSKAQTEPPIKHEESYDKLNDEPYESAKIQKHRKFWSSTEKELFLEGFRRYGNKWSKISKLLGTRTTLQVKSFARQFLKQSAVSAHGVELRQMEDCTVPCDPWQKCEDVEDDKSQLILVNPTEIPDSEEANAVKAESSTTAEEVVRLHRENSCSDNEEVDIEGLTEERETIDTAQHQLVLTEDENADKKEITYQLHDEFGDTFVDRNSQDSADSEETEKLSEDVNFDSMDGLRTFRFEVPEKELQLERNVITLNEKLVQREFFEGRPQKTPERYLKIRNYILDSWERSKPSYLNKTSVRPGLKNCGDVNCIGRIHTYLEQIGAINFGCEQTVYNQSVLVDGSKKLTSVTANKKIPILMLSKQFERTETMRPRKRKVPDLTDGSENHGYTIEHGDNGEIIDVAAVVKYKKRRKIPTNPFHLISCLEFSPSQPAPYSIEIDVRAVFIMDLHAHLSSLEVIGLLGGRYDFNTSTLYVLQAEPCRSISTGLECEMDPVSQTVASEKLEQEGCSIVGWYHSHPTFAPNPSVRDLETQTKFQHWFSKGGTPFLGVIVSPHIPTSPFSKFRYLMVDTDSALTGGCHQPLKFEPAFIMENGESTVEDYGILIAKHLLESSDDYKMSFSSVKKIINDVHRHLTAAGADHQTRTAILAKLGKQLVDIATPNDHTPNQPELMSKEFTENAIETNI